MKQLKDKVYEVKFTMELIKKGLQSTY